MMIVFSKEFGSSDPFIDAIHTARWMSEHDAHSFMPHVGIASGFVTVGYVGTPIKYNCSVFGSAVTLAARCAAVKTNPEDNLSFSSCIVFPSSEWNGNDFKAIFPPREYKLPDGTIHNQPHSWQLFQPRFVEMKNIGKVYIQEIANRAVHLPSLSAEDRARLSLRELIEMGRYWP